MANEQGDVEIAILDGMRTAMTTVPLRSVKVTTLCRDCGINRTTFYDHFSDVYAVAQRLEDDIVDELASACDSVRSNESGSYEICLMFLQFFETRRDTVSALLANETAGKFMARLNGVIQSLFRFQLDKRYDTSKLAPDELNDLLAFVSAGFYHFYLQADASTPHDGTTTRLEGRARIVSAYCDAGIERVLNCRPS